MKKSSYEVELGVCLEDPVISWDMLNGASILVTGATGLIGSCLVKIVLSHAQRSTTPLTVYALVRDKSRAKAQFAEYCDTGNLVFLEGDVCDPVNLDVSVDYVIHAASRTDSDGFIKDPVSIINITVEGTKNILEFCRTHSAKKMIYLSSMEVYGANFTEDLISEQCCGEVNPLQVRSCYPESKRTAEALCVAYHSQFGVPVSIARLAQVFGPGVSKTEKRVFMYFAKCALEGAPVKLATTGESTRMYLSSIDAVSALLVMLDRSVDGEAYNLANKETYCSIKDLARIAFESLSDNEASIVIEPPKGISKYPPTHHLRLDTSKIEALGWRPLFGLKEMYTSMVEYM